MPQRQSRRSLGESGEILKQLRAVFLGCLALAGQVWAEQQPLVLSSIKPLQLLVAEVGGEAIDSRVLIPATSSPHDFQLKPSDVQHIREADVVLWIGPNLEPSLSKLLRKRDNATALYPVVGVGEDPHFWLDGDEVQQMAHRIARLLSNLLPVRSAYFHANAARFSAEFRQYDKQLAESLARLSPRPYLLFHDGFSRFEGHYGLPEAEVVMVSEDQMPGARHIVNLRKRLQSGEFACVFREPQFSEALLEALVSGLSVPVIEVDPLGMKLGEADGFLALYRQLGEGFLSCFES